MWVGLQPNGGIPQLVGGGFELAAGARNSVTAPAAWGGRFWGRTGNEIDLSASAIIFGFVFAIIFGFANLTCGDHQGVISIAPGRERA